MTTAAAHAERAWTLVLRRAARRVITTQLATPRSLAHWFITDETAAEAILADLEAHGVVRRPAAGAPSWEVLHPAPGLRALGPLVDRLIPRPPDEMTHADAAELIRGYAPGGSTLEQALDYAERETRVEQLERIRRAAQLLGLRP